MVTNPRDHAGHPLRAEPAEATDTAGVPWRDRGLSPSGFEGDTGASDAELLAALAGADESAMMTAVAAGRFLVAVVAHAHETESGADGLVRDTGVEMALVTLVAPDGRRALPAFTGVNELAAWDPNARPVPVTGDRLGQAAVAESCEVIVLNLGSPDARELRQSHVWALAMRRPWTPAHTDDFVAAAVAAAVAEEPSVTGHTLSAAAAGGLGVELTLRPGLDHGQVEALVTRIGEGLASNGEFRARIDGLAFRLR